MSDSAGEENTTRGSAKSATAPVEYEQALAATEWQAMAGCGYRRYALALLMVICVLNFIDRQVVSILAEPIKQDLRLADWQLGMMTGLAFALFYTLMGIPIARFAERGDRALIISAAVAVWSGFSALCGLAQNFTQLVMARIGVGVGEAGCTPPALSLISDLVPREERASAISLYMLGVPVGSLLGLAFGGLLADAYGWRTAFLIVGLPGVFIAVVTAATLREPRRRLGRIHGAAAAIPSFRDALRELAGKRSYCFIVCGITLKAFISYGSTAFIGSFFFRNFPAELATVSAQFGLKSAGFLGVTLGLTTGVMSIIGTLLGGSFGDRFALRDARAYAVIPAVAAIAGLPFSLAVLNSGSLAAAFAFLMALSLLNALWIGPAYAVVQGLVRADMRATATAVLLCVSNLIGLGLGPLAVGIFSDVLFNQAGLSEASAIRWSLTSFAFLAIPCSLLFWAARKTLREELVS